MVTDRYLPATDGFSPGCPPMVSPPQAPHDLWSVDESSLAALTHALSTQTSEDLSRSGDTCAER